MSLVPTTYQVTKGQFDFLVQRNEYPDSRRSITSYLKVKDLGDLLAVFVVEDFMLKTLNPKGVNPGEDMVLVTTKDFSSLGIGVDVESAMESYLGGKCSAKDLRSDFNINAPMITPYEFEYLRYVGPNELQILVLAEFEGKYFAKTSYKIPTR